MYVEMRSGINCQQQRCRMNRSRASCVSAGHEEFFLHSNFSVNMAGNPCDGGFL